MEVLKIKPTMEQEKNQQEPNAASQWGLPPRWRIAIAALLIYVALFLGSPYSNFILGAIAGVIIYPVVDMLVHLYLHRNS